MGVSTKKSYREVILPDLYGLNPNEWMISMDAKNITIWQDGEGNVQSGWVVCFIKRKLINYGK